MPIDDVFKNISYDIFLTLGKVGTYNPSAGGSIACHVVITDMIDLQPGEYQASYAIGTHVLECLISEVLAEPVRLDTFIVGITTYTVQAPMANDGQVVKLAVK